MNEENQLTGPERAILLKEARYSLETSVSGGQLAPLNLAETPPKLSQPGVVFVTLTIDNQLRGCVGALEAYQPLIMDVREHAIAAALRDYRFAPVSVDEFEEIKIEISRLTTPVPLKYQGPEDLLEKIRPGIDGVIIKDGSRRATFLPQVWEKVPTPTAFLEHLCLKLGGPSDLWRQKKVEVLIYQVEEFHE
jgi:AmmeMemoRadiSam system protein A